MGNCNLPQELIDIILDNLHDDYRALHSCSLVCHSWLPTCHRHIFHHVVLLPTNKYVLYAKHPIKSYSQRLHRILFNSPYIANYIQQLKVYEGQFAKHEDWIRTDQTLPLVLRSLTNLKRIEFRRLYWNDLPLDLRRSIGSVLELPSLTFIEIENAHFAGMDELVGLLQRARRLTGLSLTNISTDTKPPVDKDRDTVEEEQRFDLRQRGLLVDLRLALVDYPLFIKWVLGPQSPFEVSHIHTLHISDPYSDIKTFNRLLHAIGGSLNHIQLSVPLWDLLSECA
jgi:hypothetical protein